MKIGTVAGRHPLPVDMYLLEEATPGQSAYDAAYEAARMIGLDEVDLYYTGLTEITIGAIDGLDSVGVKVRLMRYNASSGEYEQLYRKES
jgi:hypothetical protein